MAEAHVDKAEVRAEQLQQGMNEEWLHKEKTELELEMYKAMAGCYTLCNTTLELRSLLLPDPSLFQDP